MLCCLILLVNWGATTQLIVIGNQCHSMQLRIWASTASQWGLKGPVGIAMLAAFRTNLNSYSMSMGDVVVLRHTHMPSNQPCTLKVPTNSFNVSFSTKCSPLAMPHTTWLLPPSQSITLRCVHFQNMSAITTYITLYHVSMYSGTPPYAQCRLAPFDTPNWIYCSSIMSAESSGFIVVELIVSIICMYVDVMS